MFGYLKPYKPELKFKYYEYHKKLYCSLCSQIGRDFGCFYRIFDSFDITVFLYLFDFLKKDKNEFYIKCPFHLLKNKKKNIISCEALEYASFINMFWVFTKCKDDIKDEKKLLGRIGYNLILLSRKFKKVFYKYNDIISKITPIIEEYYEFEKNASEGDFDKLSNQMGHLYGVVCYEYALNGDYPELLDDIYEIGFIFGKWIYIIDALDDYSDDIVKHRFNPIFYLYGYDSKNKEHFIDKISIMHMYMTMRLSNIIVSFPECYQKNLLVNIAEYGMNNTIRRIIKQKYFDDHINNTKTKEEYV